MIAITKSSQNKFALVAIPALAVLDWGKETPMHLASANVTPTALVWVKGIHTVLALAKGTPTALDWAKGTPTVSVLVKGAPTALA